MSSAIRIFITNFPKLWHFIGIIGKGSLQSSSFSTSSSTTGIQYAALLQLGVAKIFLVPLVCSVTISLGSLQTWESFALPLRKVPASNPVWISELCH